MHMKSMRSLKQVVILLIFISFSVIYCSAFCLRGVVSSCKTEEALIKPCIYALDNNKTMGLFDAMVTIFLNQSGLKLYSHSLTQTMLYLVHDQDWPAGLGDILVE